MESSVRGPDLGDRPRRRARGSPPPPAASTHTVPTILEGGTHAEKWNRGIVLSLIFICIYYNVK
jgi:hypothetical protein